MTAKHSALLCPHPYLLLNGRTGESQEFFLEFLELVYLLHLEPLAISISSVSATVLALFSTPHLLSRTYLPSPELIPAHPLSWASAEPRILINKMWCCPPGPASSNSGKETAENYKVSHRRGPGLGMGAHSLTCPVPRCILRQTLSEVTSKPTQPQPVYRKWALTRESLSESLHMKEMCATK